MLSRLFCLGGGPSGGVRDDGWGGNPQYGHLVGATGRARVLEVLAAELEERFAALPSQPAQHTSQDQLLLRRLYQANLPSAEANLCRELLRKLGAIDAARQAAVAEQQQLQSQLKAAEAAHRQGEFARARAEAIATARGEALMTAQQHHRELEAERLQLEEMAMMLLERQGMCGQLGIDPAAVRASLRAQRETQNGKPSTPRQSIFSKEQLEAVTASLSKLPRQSQAGTQQGLERQRSRLAEVSSAAAGPGEHQQQLLQEEHRRSSSSSQDPGEPHHQQQRQGGGDPAAAVMASQDGPQLSGFTVYTNGLQAPEYADGDSGAGRAAQQQQAAAAGEQRLEDEHERLQQSGGGLAAERSSVQWRSISSAALSRSSADSASLAEVGAAAAAVAAQRQHSQGSHASSCRERPQGSGGGEERRSVSSLEQLAASEEWALPAVADTGASADGFGPTSKLQQRAQQLSKLVVPAVEASQLDSLVHIGASLQSPDPYGLPAGAMQQQLLPPEWEERVQQWEGGAGANPVPSSEETDRLVAHLRAQLQQQGPGAGASTAAAGSRQSSQDGMQGLAAGVPGLPPGLPAGLELYPDGKVPGAGTWVSPSWAAMLAHKKKKGFDSMDGAEPSPPSHIKAVFGTTADKEFYGPMAAHLNRREQPGEVQRATAAAAATTSSRPPSSTADSIQGPRQAAASSRGGSSVEALESTEWDRQQQLLQPRRQAPSAGPSPQRAAALAAQGAGGSTSRAGGVLRQSGTLADSRGSFAGAAPPQQQQQQPPEKRQAAFLNRFQPMGMSAQQSTLPAQQQQQAQSQQQRRTSLQPAPRRSSIAVSQLGGGSQRSSISADENLAAGAGLGKASLRGSGLPPRGQPPAAVKRSLDSMRSSLAGPAASSIQESMSAVEAAMSALAAGNPQLRQQHAAAQQAQALQGRPLPLPPHARSSAGAGIAGLPRMAQHVRTKSLPEEVDLSLSVMAERTNSWQRQAQAAAALQPGSRPAYRY